jgi:hypothetical protein
MKTPNEKFKGISCPSKSNSRALNNYQIIKGNRTFLRVSTSLQWLAECKVFVAQSLKELQHQYD